MVIERLSKEFSARGPEVLCAIYSPQIGIRGNTLGFEHPRIQFGEVHFRGVGTD